MYIGNYIIYLILVGIWMIKPISDTIDKIKMRSGKYYRTEQTTHTFTGVVSTYKYHRIPEGESY